jgi:hypothetical protein
MSLTYGYDPNGGDEFMAAPIEATEMMSRVIPPGAIYSQCGTFTHGFHFSTTGH